MTSEAGSTTRRRPPTIDLTATEIETEKPAADAAGHAQAGEGGDSAPPQANARRIFADSGKPLAIGAGAGALVVAAVAAALWFGGLVPGSNTPSGTPAANTAPAPGDGAGISAQLEKIQAELQARQSEAAFTARIAGLEAQIKTLGDTLAALNRRIDGVAVSAQNALERANDASQAAKGTAPGAVQKSDIDALSSRLAALEDAVKTLSAGQARRPASADDRAARTALAAEALRANVERDAPYSAELAAVKSFGVDQTATAPLEPFAASGIPSAADLAHELSLLTPSLANIVDGAPSGGNFLGRLETHARGLVRITPVDAPAGDDPSSVIARLTIEAARGDLTAARADIARLPPAAKTLAAPWLAKVDARDAAIAASRQIAGDALAGLGQSKTQ